MTLVNYVLGMINKNIDVGDVLATYSHFNGYVDLKGMKLKKIIFLFGVLTPSSFDSDELRKFLFLCVRLGHNISLKAILESGIDCDYYDENQDTPLIIAARKGNEESVRLLLEHGADPFHKNKDNHNAGDYAIDKPEILALLDPQDEQLLPATSTSRSSKNLGEASSNGLFHTKAKDKEQDLQTKNEATNSSC